MTDAIDRVNAALDADDPLSVCSIIDIAKLLDAYDETKAKLAAASAAADKWLAVADDMEHQRNVAQAKLAATESVANLAQRRHTELGNLRALFQEDDHRAWVLLGRPENTRTTNVVLLMDRFSKLCELIQKGLALHSAESLNKFAAGANAFDSFACATHNIFEEMRLAAPAAKDGAP